MLKRLYEIRKKRGFSQKEMARRLHISRSNYGYYENGRRWPSAETLIEMGKILDVSIDYLLGLTNNPNMHRQISEREEHYLTRYRSMDERGRETVDEVLLFEERRFSSSDE